MSDAAEGPAGSEPGSFEDQVDHAWSRYRLLLIEMLTDLHRPDHTSVGPGAASPDPDPRTLDATSPRTGTPDAGPARIVFTVTGSARLRATIAPQTEATAAALTTAGWRHLRDRRLIRETSRRTPEVLADAAIDVLQRIWGVIHPVFLDGSPHSQVPPSSNLPAAHPPDGPMRADARLLGRAARILGDFDNTWVSFHHLRAQATIVTVGLPTSLQATTDGHILGFSVRLGAVTDRVQLGEIVEEQGEQWRGVSFHVIDGHLYATYTVDCTESTDDTIRRAFLRWHRFLSRRAHQIRSTLERMPADAHICAPEVPEQLTAIIRRRRREPLTAGTVVRLLHADVALILSYLRVCDQQIIEWTEMAHGATTQDADRKDLLFEADAWNETSTLLREALQEAVRLNRGAR